MSDLRRLCDLGNNNKLFIVSRVLNYYNIEWFIFVGKIVVIALLLGVKK